MVASVEPSVRVGVTEELRLALGRELPHFFDGTTGAVI
jgi:hypothetical protein